MTPRRKCLLLACLGGPIFACATSPAPPAAAPPQPAPHLEPAPASVATGTEPLPKGEATSEEKEDAKDTDALPGVAVSPGVRIPMRDGVTLSATLYRAAGAAEKRPVLFDVTPYVADSSHEWAVYYARHGYVVASVDIRGRGDSGGAFDPWHPHPMDMTDTVEWLARQPWSSGKVAMMGGSYLGMTQWWTAREVPPHLTTIVPIAAVCMGVDFPFVNGIAVTFAVQWLAFVQGRALNPQLFNDDDLWRRGYDDFLVKEQPFQSFDAFMGAPSRAFQEMLRHRTYDAYWRASRPTPEQYRSMRQPVLTVTGAFDADQPGALTYYRDHMRYGAPEVAAEHYLVLGPWDHAGTRAPKRDVGGLRFGEASVVDVKMLGESWYDWRMKDGKRPDFLKARVAYYVAGPHAERWKYAQTLDGATRDRMRFFLASTGGAAGDLFHSGALLRSPPDAAHAAPDRYAYDPGDVVDRRHPRRSHDDDWLTTEDGLTDLHGAALVYHSAPLPEEVELAGTMRLSVWLAMDVPDTDVHAAVYEITADGKSIQLGQDFVRARYRESLAKETLVPSGVPLRYDFDHFWWFARRLAKGSRIRVVFGGSAFTGLEKLTDLEKNYDATGPVADESAKDSRVAHVTLLHDDAHPSVLDLPVGQ